MGFKHGLIRALAVVLWDCSCFCLFVVMTSFSCILLLEWHSNTGSHSFLSTYHHLNSRCLGFRVPSRILSFALQGTFLNQSWGPGRYPVLTGLGLRYLSQSL